MIEKKSVKVQQVTPVIHLGKSKRLMAMRQSLNQAGAQKKETQLSPARRQKKCEIDVIRERISQEIVKIKSGYPKNMKDKLFTLRYDSEEKMNGMSLQALFTLLKIQEEIGGEFRNTLYKE